MTELLHRNDAYLRECEATVTGVGENTVRLDRTVFYALGGGQPGDTGSLQWDGGKAAIIDTRYGDDGSVEHISEEGAALPPFGTEVTATLDWERRFIHMRMHTALHLVGSIIPFGVTGGNISVAKSRLDFDTSEPIDKEEITRQLLALVEANKAISCRWITDEDLEAQPDLVRTMSVKPPKGSGQVRLLEIQDIDLQPCGGTHLKSTGEVGQVRVSKVENKGKHNRRVNIVLDG
jgi:misacylated tRNA(Ala) deacylase